jgi:hypothetical protein
MYIMHWNYADLLACPDGYIPLIPDVVRKLNGTDAK